MLRSRGPGRSLYLLAAVLYFSEGFPNGAVTELLPLYLRTQGVTLGRIGLLSTVSLAWSVKVFWAPLVDRFSSYRLWILSALGALTAGWGILSLARADQPLFWSAVAVLAIASATQDIAVDALTVERTPRSDLGPVNSIRVTAYRVAIILAGGGMAALSSRMGWPGVFRLGGLVSLLLLLIVSFVPEEHRRVPADGSILQVPGWMRSRRGAVVVAVVLLYRLGDAALAPMVKPFWIDRHYSAAEAGVITTAFGMSLTVAGAIAGGMAVKRFGIQRALLWLGFLQMISNAGYAAVAGAGAGRPGMYAAAGVESFCGGLGTAAFLAFLMFLCDPGRAATEYAFLTGLYALTRAGIGSASGFLAQQLGYARYFWLTALLGIPALLLIPMLRLERPAGPEGAAA